MKFNLTAAPVEGSVMGMSVIVLDPDGEDGFGGQLQTWGWAENASTYADLGFARRTLTVSQNRAGGRPWQGTETPLADLLIPLRYRSAKPVVGPNSSWGQSNSSPRKEIRPTTSGA